MDAEILNAGGPSHREGMDAEIPMSRRSNAVRESRQSGLAAVVSLASEKSTRRENSGHQCAWRRGVVLAHESTLRYDCITRLTRGAA